MSTIAKFLLASLAALLLCAGEGALFAADTAGAGSQRSISVRYADLNLDRPAHGAASTTGSRPPPAAPAAHAI